MIVQLHQTDESLPTNGSELVFPPDCWEGVMRGAHVVQPGLSRDSALPIFYRPLAAIQTSGSIRHTAFKLTPRHT